MNDFSSREMNGYGAVQAPQGLRPLDTVKPAALVDGYRQDVSNNFQREKPRFVPMGTGKMQKLALVELKDPVQMHLLAETALFDSREYEILSQDEVDDLKKQMTFLSQRIQQTRASLAVQTKYRDAAVSMSKLYNPANKRRSLLGNRASGGDAAREAEAERESIQKKCEELAVELWTLERRMITPQRRLLEHTAGILQMTHKSGGKKISTPTPKVPLLNGVPASPESMYTGSHGRNSMEPDDVSLFDDDSLYRSFSDLDGFDMRSKQRTIEIPQKSPVREQHKQLTEESERLREENAMLKQQTGALSAELEEYKSQSTDQWRLISDTEQKLEVFNNQLRQVIVKKNPGRNSSYSNPPSGRLEPGDMIGSHLEYMEKAVAAVGEDMGGNSQAAEAVQDLNSQLQELLITNGRSSHPSPPDAYSGLDDQLSYMRDAVDAIDSTLQRTAEMASASSASLQKGEQAEAILMGLWEIIQSGYADIQQRKQDRRKTRLEKGFEPEDDDMSDTDSFDSSEQYSLNAFSAKVQWLYAQATQLKEQKSVLKRQIKQQRDLNSKSDSEKDEALRNKAGELEEARSLLTRSERDADDVRKQLADAYANLEVAKTQATQSGQEQSSAIQEAQSQLKERNAKIAALEATASDVQMRLAAAEANIATITAQLKDANDARSQVERALEEKTLEVKVKQDELDEMTGMVAEFKMEATLAKAELDGAYGSRRERAAEVAALANTSESAKLQAKVDRLQPRVDQLEQELKGSVQDLKDITKQAIDAESKIADLESELDKVTQAARKEKEQLQEALDQERFKSNSIPLSPSGRPNASILTDSYREALRTERKKHDEQLKAEQTLRRRLEEELRTFRRAAGPGKSPLSPRV
ncbi:involucrin repeat protein [Xylariales sp. PMI_506]|nr:involucrin repeat protein [Xylariales sp. PMI_506]